MKIAIKDLGPIKHAEIDISKRFYLFFGHNNTGKTYLSKAMFLLFRGQTMREFLNSQECKSITVELSPENTFTILPSFTRHLAKTFFDFFVQKIDYSSSVKIDIIDFDDEVVLQKEQRSIMRIFRNNSPQEVMRIKKQANSNIIELVYKELEKEDEEGEGEDRELSIQNLVARAGDNIKRMILSTLLGDNDTYNAHYFPADRAFYLKNHDLLIYQQAKRLEEIRKRLEKDSESENLTNDIIFMAQRNYTNAEDILVEQLMSLDSAIKRDRLAKKDTYSKIQEDFSHILGGKILEELTDINGLKILKWKYHFKDKKETISLPLSQSSSMVNQLASLALYFDYMARGKRDFLFIDEPEENLHPKAQTALLDVLLEFASMNENRVLIASHSPLMADALNNYIYWANIRDKASKEQKIQQPEGLSADIQGLSASNFVVYSFETNGKVKEYGFDEVGVYFKSFETEQKNIQYIQQDLMEIEHKLKEIANI